MTSKSLSPYSLNNDFFIFIQIKQAHDRQEEWRDAYNELETMLTTETVYTRNN